MVGYNGKLLVFCYTSFHVGVIFFTVVMYVISLAGIILMYVFFTDVSDSPSPCDTQCMICIIQPDGGCGLNYFFISFHLFMSIVISVLAILPPVQNGLYMDHVNVVVIVHMIILQHSQDQDYYKLLS